MSEQSKALSQMQRWVESTSEARSEYLAARAWQNEVWHRLSQEPLTLDQLRRIVAILDETKGEQ